MSITDAQQRDAEYQRVSHDLRVAADKLNDAIIMAIRSGLSVHVEVMEVSGQGESEIRPMIVVNPHLLLRF